MFLDIGVNITLITITVLFQVVALVLLNLNKEFGRNKTQVYIIAALFIYELFSYILLGIDAGIYYGTDLYSNRIVSIIVGEFFNVFTTLVYYTLMVLLILDRFCSVLSKHQISIVLQYTEFIKSDHILCSSSIFNIHFNSSFTSNRTSSTQNSFLDFSYFIFNIRHLLLSFCCVFIYLYISGISKTSKKE